MSEDMITVRLPRSHWRQIVDDVENMCGLPARDIEILRRVDGLADVVTLLREMSAQQYRTDLEGGREIAWWYWRGDVERALGLEPGTLHPRDEEDE